MSDQRSEILELAQGIESEKFQRMIAYWRSDGFAASKWLGEWVSGSREQPLPVTVVTNDKGHDVAIHAGDALDKQMRDDRRTYMANEADIKRLLRANLGLQAKYIVPIEKPSKERLDEINSLVSDAGSCKCGEVKEVWQREHKTPWRIKAGLGPCCYSSWRASGLEQSVFLRHHRSTEQAS